VKINQARISHGKLAEELEINKMLGVKVHRRHNENEKGKKKTDDETIEL
jgi:hypothetical protein